MTHAVAPHPGLSDEITDLLNIRPDLVASPYDLFRRLHESASVAYARESYVVSDFAVAKDILHRAAVFKSEDAAGFTKFYDNDIRADQRQMFDFMMSFELSLTARMDDPRHAFHRKMVAKPFGLREVAAVDDLILSLVATKLREIETNGSDEFDMLSEFAGTIPASVITALFGVPEADRMQLKLWTDSLARWRGSPAALEEGYDAAVAFRDYVRTTLLADEASTATEIMQSLLASDIDLDLMTFRLVGLILAGAETTTNLFTGGTHLLLSDGGRDWRRLGENPDLIPGAVEEMLRLTSPVQFVNRFTTEDVTLGDVEVPAGSSVLCLIGAANRDPKQFPDPDVFDIERANARQHLAFGFGIHRCLGQVLAKAEAIAGFRALTQRYPDAGLASEEVAWRPNFQLRGLAGLRVRKEAEHA